MNRLIVSALLLLAACSSRPPPPPPMDPEDLIERIAGLEDRREVNHWLMFEAAMHSTPEVRVRLAEALGRIMDPQALALLVMLRLSSDAATTRATIFATGQLALRPDGLSSEDLGAYLKMILGDMKSPDESIRAAAVEAMGKLAGENAPGLAAPLLKDPSALVRRQATGACFRWRQILRWRDPAAKPPDLPKVALDALSAAVDDPDAEVRWRAVHALWRSGAKPTPATLTRFIEDSEPLARLFALVVVERLKMAELAEIAARAQTDREASVRQASLRAIDALDRPDLLFKKLVSDPSHHVREAVADVLAEEGPELEALSKDASTAVRAAVLLARVRIGMEKAIPSLENAMKDADPGIRVAAIKGAGHLKEKGLPILKLAPADSSEDVRAAALVVLADIEGEEAWTAIQAGLRAEELAVRGSAAEALGKRKEQEALAAAMDCFRNSAGREWVEIREGIIDQLATRPPEATNAFFEEVVRTDPASSVRQKVAAVLRKRGGKGVPEDPSKSTSRSPHYGRRFDSNPVVVMQTTKGTLEIECYPREAPEHVANFVGLVEEGFYNGLKWHRVVPNFVIQGGDKLGNGWGDAGWHLRAEINPIPYMRGTLGMPRSAGFDTGGSQIFITHIPTPHLDGYYTVFGQVVKGLDVVDAIEIGDKIIRASLKK